MKTRSVDIYLGRKAQNISREKFIELMKPILEEFDVPKEAVIIQENCHYRLRDVGVNADKIIKTLKKYSDLAARKHIDPGYLVFKPLDGSYAGGRSAYRSP